MAGFKDIEHYANNFGTEAAVNILGRDAVLGVFDNADLQAEIKRREQEEKLGPAPSADALAWRSDAERFLDSSKEMKPKEQLQFMASFRAEFGQNVPQIDRLSRVSIYRVLSENPAYRVVPTLLGSVSDRKADSKPNTGSVISEIIPGKEDETDILITSADNQWTEYMKARAPLWLKDGATVWLNNRAYLRPESGQKKVPADAGANKPYQLRYKATDGTLLKRKDFLKRLVDDKQAVLAEDGGVWTFPVMDVSNPRRSTRGRADALYKDLDVVMSPEARIGVQLLYVIAGNPKDEDVIEYTNEAVTERNAQFTFDIVRAITTVTWSKERGQIRQTTTSSISDFLGWEAPKGSNGLYYLSHIDELSPTPNSTGRRDA